MMITVAPPVVHPSLGLMALIQGVAAGTGYPGEERGYVYYISFDSRNRMKIVHFFPPTNPTSFMFNVDYKYNCRALEIFLL